MGNSLAMIMVGFCKFGTRISRPGRCGARDRGTGKKRRFPLQIPHNLINAVGKARRMCHRVCYWPVTCTSKANTQVGWRPEYEVSPPLTNLRKSVPPAFHGPFISPQDTAIFTLIVVRNNQPTETKYVEERNITEEMDKCTMWSVVREPCLLTIR
jgi:hypothetical protein